MTMKITEDATADIEALASFIRGLDWGAKPSDELIQFVAGFARFAPDVESGDGAADEVAENLVYYFREHALRALEEAAGPVLPEAALDEWRAQAEKSGTAVYFPFGDPVAAAEAEYDIEIIDHGFEPDTYAGWNVQFQVKGLPRLSYQKQDPILDAFIPLERAPENALKLGTGSSSSALARTDESEKLTTAMMGGGQEGNILRGFTGAAVVEVRPVTHGNAPTMLPPEDKLRAACRRSIDRHLAAVAEERKRLVVTETGDQVIGKKLKV